MSVKERTVFKIAAEYGARLGVSVPEIVVQQSKIVVHPWGLPGKRVVGEHGGHYIMIDRRRPFSATRRTIAHEFIHRAFPNLRHGQEFKRRVEALMDGEMFFRGSMRRPDKIV